MNKSKYVSPQKINRNVVSLKTFCSDCKRDKINCNKNVIECLQEAQLYQEFIKIDVE